MKKAVFLLAVCCSHASVLTVPSAVLLGEQQPHQAMVVGQPAASATAVYSGIAQSALNFESVVVVGYDDISCQSSGNNHCGTILYSTNYGASFHTAVFGNSSFPFHYSNTDFRDVIFLDCRQNTARFSGSNACAGSASCFMAVGNNQLYVSTDGMHWTSKNDAVSGAFNLMQIAYNNNNNGNIACGDIAAATNGSKILCYSNNEWSQLTLLHDSGEDKNGTFTHIGYSGTYYITDGDNSLYYITGGVYQGGMFTEQATIMPETGSITIKDIYDNFVVGKSGTDNAMLLNCKNESISCVTYTGGNNQPPDICGYESTGVNKPINCQTFYSVVTFKNSYYGDVVATLDDYNFLLFDPVNPLFLMSRQFHNRVTDLPDDVLKMRAITNAKGYQILMVVGKKGLIESAASY